eukprot:561918-Hanusia_phi.AAC.1
MESLCHCGAAETLCCNRLASAGLCTSDPDSTAQHGRPCGRVALSVDAAAATAMSGLLQHAGAQGRTVHQSEVHANDSLHGNFGGFCDCGAAEALQHALCRRLSAGGVY